MNNPSFDRLMMEASAAAYNVSVTDPANHIATLTGSDPDGIAYQVDQNYVVQNTLLDAYGYKIEAGFDDASTQDPQGFKVFKDSDSLIRE